MFYKWLAFLFILPLWANAQSEQSSIFYKENGLWGLKDEKRITPAVYDTLITILTSELLIAKKHQSKEGINSTGVINRKGKVIIPFSYLQITPSSTNFIVKKWTNSEVVYGVLNQANKVILNVRFKMIHAINNHWVASSTANNLQLYNADGILIKQLSADSVSITDQTGFMYLYKAGKVGLNNYTGVELFAPQFKSIDYIEDKWQTKDFSTWQIFSASDSLTIKADSLFVWNNKTQISILNDEVYILSGIRSVGNTYNSIKIESPTLGISKKMAKFGAIGSDGQEILSPRFRRIYYKKGYFYTQKNQLWSVYDSLGNKRSVFEYDSIGEVNNGLFPIKRKGKWGFMNRNGKEVIHCIYDTEANFKKSKAIISYFGVKGIIDLSGNWVVKPSYTNITDFSFNFFICQKGEIYYLKNYSNYLIYFSSYPLVFKDETIFEIRPNATNEISSIGTRVQADPTFSNASQYWQVIKIGSKYGFVDTKGVLKITYRYDSLLVFSEHLAAFKLRGKWGFINTDEKIIVQPHYTEVTPFKNRVSVVTTNGKKGLMGIHGKAILKPKYEDISLLKDDLWLVTEHKLIGLFNSQGNIIIQPKYDTLTYINNELIIVARKGKYGVVNIKGASILPRVYDYIGYDYANEVLLMKRRK